MRDNRCEFCNKDMNKLILRHRRRYCDNNCLKRALAVLRMNNRKNKGYVEGLTRIRIGEISEYLVVSDLLKKGYEVYKSLTQTSSSDLVIRKENKIFTVDVKTSSYPLDYFIPRIKHKSDIMAIIGMDNNEIKYVGNGFDFNI